MVYPKLGASTAIRYMENYRDCGICKIAVKCSEGLFLDVIDLSLAGTHVFEYSYKGCSFSLLLHNDIR